MTNPISSPGGRQPAALRAYVQHKPDCEVHLANLCVCGCLETDHERIWDPEKEPKPGFFGFCNGCRRLGRKYPATHHDYSLGKTRRCTCGLADLLAALASGISPRHGSPLTNVCHIGEFGLAQCEQAAAWAQAVAKQSERV